MSLGDFHNTRRTATPAALAALALLSGCALTGMDWSRGGEILNPGYRTVAHEVDYASLGLPPPPAGLRWYHVDKAYVLASRTTGLIVRTLPDTARPAAPGS
jgi:Ni/Co efflux regulator RcnB